MVSEESVKGPAVPGLDERPETAAAGGGLQAAEGVEEADLERARSSREQRRRSTQP